MSYSRSSFRSTSSSYKYSEGLSDDSYSRTSLTSSARSSRLHDDSLTSRTSRFSSSITGTGDDDITSIRRTSLRGTRFDDDDSGIISSYRRTSRTSSRGDDDDLGISSYRRRTSGLSDDDDTFSFRRTKISSSYEIDDGIKTLKSRQTTLSESSDDSAFSSYLKYGARASKQDSVSEEVEAKPGDIFATVLDYEPPKSDVEGIPLKEGQEVECIETTNPRRWKVKTIATSTTEEVLEGWVPSCYLEKKADAAPKSPTLDPKMQEAKTKREALVKELVETEEDFARDLLYVVNNYIKEMETGSRMPKELRDQKDVVFSNFKAISDVHNNVLMKGVQYYASEPAKLGKTFLRLERDFDMHVTYCRDEPLAQEALSSGPLKEYFDDFSKRIGDDKSLSDHLKLPIQRINDYQLLLKEILKCTARLKEETDDLERALELMQAIPQRIADQKYLNSLHGYKGNINKLGRILKREWLEVTDENNVTKEKLVFLFKRHVFVADERRLGEDKSAYLVKNIIKLQEADIQESVEGDSKKIVIKSKKGDQLLTFKTKTSEQKEEWVKEIHSTSVSHVAEDLGDDEPELLHEEVISEPQEKKPKLTKEGTETKSMDVEEKVISETDAKVEILEDFEAYEEMNTAITESLRSGSLTSLEDFQSALEDEPSCVTASEMEGAPGKPLFSKPLHGLVCTLGESPTFDCQIATTTPTSVMWLKDNMPVTSSDRLIISSDDIKHCLTIKNVTSEDSGLYTVVVTNAQGTNSCSATLCTQAGLETERPTSPGGTKLPYAPVFKEKLMNSQLIEGTNARFTITVDGAPEPTVTFYKDENELKQDNRIKVISTISGVYELAMDNVTLSDAGKYSCIAVNSEGRDVTAGNITITKEKVVLQVTHESEALSFSTGRDSKEPQYTWFKDGSEIEASERFKVAYSDEEDTLALVFQKVTPEDAGLYTCVACTSSGKISCSAELTVQGAELPRDHEAPVLTASLKDVEVSEGSSALLELKSTGYPKPKVTWFKDGEEIKANERIKFLFEDSESYTLVIKKVQKSDSGEYNATVKNDMGEVKCSCQLLVKSAPVFKKQMKDMAVMTDEPVKFEVEVEGAPTPEIRWLKDGQELLKSDRIKMLHEAELHTLLIEKAKCEDSGNYSCVASNTSGVQSGFAALSVNAPAAFSEKMKSTETVEEETTTFSVKVAGNPKPKVKWMKDGKELKEDKHYKIVEDGNSYLLIIEKVKMEDDGKYSCEIKNEYGSDTTSGNLTVNGKPSFTQKLSNVEVKEGEDANFTVKVSGKPEPKIKWYIGSMEITESQNYKFVDEKDSGKYTLQVKSVNSKLSGEYTCEASNSVGTESTSGKLLVKDVWEPAEFVQTLKDTTVKSGEDAEFTVKIKGHPTPSVKWNKDGAELTIDNKHIKVVEEASDSLTLLLTKVDSKDVGNYSCEIKNERGSETCSGKLNVQTPATFLKGLKDTEAEENMDVSFNIKIAGDPKPKVKWTKDGAELTIDGNHIKSVEEESAELTLTIQQIKKEDVGTYSCEIINEYGKDVSSCKLGVASKPTFKKKLTDKQSIEGEENVEFVVEVDGSPAPTLNWYKGDSEVTSDKQYKVVSDESTHKLVIKKVTPEMEGNYTCKAKNPYGSADTSAAFTVQLKPKIIEGLKDVVVEEGKPVSLTVKAAALPSSDVKWKKNGEEVFEEATIKIKKELPNTTVLVIEKTTISMSGEYTCIITNNLGEASTSGKLTIKTKPKFEKGLKDMDVWTNEESVFEVIVKGSPTPSVTWSKDDKTVTESEHIKIIKEENTYRLIIKSTKMEDSGTYKCIAKNDVGDATETGLLSVKNADDSQLPTFIRGLADQEILVGDAVRMEVKVVGKPSPDIIWLKNGEELSPGGRIKIDSVIEDNYYSLTIKDVTLEDEGEYVCKATNEKGESSSSSKLLVEEPTEPEIKGIKNMEAALAGVAKFEAEVTGIPAPDVQWLKDGKPLRESKDIVCSEDDTTHHFTVIIRNVKEEHVGTYTCVAKNSAGEASSEGKLSIKNEAPAFIKQIGDQEAKKGDNIIFEVRVSGYPLPEISWLKNTNAIITGDHCKISSKDDVFKLEIINATVDDIGTYTCKAKNSSGEVQCKGALHLIEVAPTIQKGLHAIIAAKEGEPLKLEAKFDGEPKPEIKWMKDNNEIKPSDHVKIETKPDGSTKLIIDNLKPEDAGNYAVVANNAKGQTDSQSKVTVEPKSKKVKPSFTKQLEMQECVQGEKVELIAKVSGEPMPVITWFKDGKEVGSSDRISMKVDADGKIQLVINNTTSEDSGEYKAVATNDIGEASSVAKVTVNVPVPPKEEVPAPVLKQEEKEKVPAETAKIAPSTETAPPKAPSEVSTTTPETPAIPSTEKALPPGKVPEFLAGLKPAQFTEGEPGVLTAKISGEPLPQVKWLKNGKPILPNDRYTYSENPDGTVSLTIDKVRPEDAGKYAVVISNDRGEEKSEAPVATIPALKGKARPKFRIVDGLIPIMLTEGKDGKLQAKVTGEVKPVATWKLNGKEISSDDHIKAVVEPDGTYALIINKATSADAGKYAVVFTDASGEEESEALVTVVPAIAIPPLGKKPEFTQELQAKQLTAGQPLVLTAKIASEPKATIKWLKDGDEIKAGPGVVIKAEPDGTNTLTIDNVSLDDAGKYVIVATNDEGKTRSAAPIDVKGPPKKKPEFLVDLQPVSCNDGQPVTIKAKISGEPKPQIKWIKDGEEIKPSNHVEMKEEPDGTVALHIPKTTPKDSGKYSIAIANEEGETRCSAPLTVNQPPVFVRPLMPVTVINGFPAKLETKVAGVPKPVVEWLKNGEPFVADGEHVKLYSPDGTASLVFEKTKPAHAAKYTCNAKNDYGESHASGDLHVIEKEVSNEPETAPSFLTHLSDVSVLEEETIKFEATVSGNPMPDIHWFLDEQPILPSNNIHPTFDGKKISLEIKRCNPQHAGDYECHLVNRAGNAVSKAKAKVKGFSAPEFIQKLVDIESPTKDPVKLVCRVEGVPEPSVEWYRNGDLLYPGIKYSMLKQGDQCHLNIPYPRPRDSGKYECHAKNIMGEDKCSAKIEISDIAERGEQPIFLKKLINVDALEGRGAKFTACVTGIPKPLVKWFKDGEQLEQSDHYRMEHEPNGILRLIIYQAKPTDVGEYRVSVSNKYGSDTCTARLHLEGVDEYVPPRTGDQDAERQRKTAPPGPLPDPPYFTRMTDTYLTLGWRPSIPSFPRVPVTYEVEMCPQPDGTWSSYKSGLKDSSCDVHGLIPGKDYRFRIRVENKHGVSDPSPYTTAHRSKIQPPLPGDYKPKDYELEHPPLEKQSSAPRFLRQEEETIYGIRGQPVRIEFWVYGNPQPEVSWHFNGLPVESGKYDYLQDRNGQVILFITRMTESDIGTYVCHAVNELGEARQKIKLEIAEVPIFTRRLEETSIMIRGKGKLECCVTGVPFPKIKWFKDWHPIYESSRVIITQTAPDKCTISLNDVILKDGGLYTCSASNVAGSTSTSAMLSIAEAETDFNLDRDAGIGVKPRNKLFEDIYDIGDELGRGTQGIIHHAVERSTGRSLAAKMMHGTEKMRDFMEAEVDIMNQLCHPRLVRLWDAFDTRTSLTLVTDLCGGGELLNNILHRPALTESNIAHYIKQLLEGLEHMHNKQIGHLGLTIGDLLITRVNSDNLKLCDFGLATRLHPGREFVQEYGHPEFVAPEIANKLPVTLAADMWSVGIISYLLLTGISPFLGENDRETLKNVQQGKVDFYHDNFAVLSDEAKDFVRKLLVFDPSGRLDVRAALRHPWLRFADVPDKCDELGCMPQLQEYAKKWRIWYGNASCKRFYRRRPLDSCFTHPSRMIYPPDLEYTPPLTPDRQLGHSHIKPAAFDDVTFQQKIIREPIDFRSESQYQSGPDTFLLPLRDKDFPVRVRQYLRLGARRSPRLADHLKEKHWADCDVVVKERRRFVDVMDEEIYDEKKGLVHSMPLRLQKEVGSFGMDVGRKKSIQYAEASPPFFREKIRDVVIRENEDAVFKCFAVSKPPPLYSWFRNDGILIESSRIVMKQQKDGHCELRLKPGKAYDVGVFKCVARNTHGVAVCRARLKIGDVPGHPEPPIVQQCSDTELYVAWNPPKNDGNSPILCYSLEYRKSDEENWTKVAKNISHEFFVIKDLSPSSTYHLRLAAKNRFGWGEASPLSEPCNTIAAGSPKVKISKARKYQQEMTERGQELFLDDLESTSLDYELEDNPVEMVEGDPLELYNFVSEVARGRFSVIVKVWVKAKNTTLMAKVMQKTPQTESAIWREYDVLRSLRHERIVSMEMASSNPTSTILIMEKLSGMDILTYFSCRHQYTEEMVAKVVQQVLDALEYLHFRGICYVELQPDNVVLTDQHHLDVKLIDFGSAQCIPEEEGKIDALGQLEYMAPETVKEHEVNRATDIWSVGILMYILLSGVSPFRGENDAETRSNVLYVRYHFDNLYKEVTQEATRFLMQLFKRTPQKRPTVEECFENKWLLPSEFMMKKREHAVFLTHRIHEFSEEFHARKRLATPPALLNMFGMSFSRSVSLETDTLEEF